MRIAIWYNLPSGGAKRALYHQVCGLVNRGHYVESWCTPSSRDGYLPIRDVVAEEHVVPVGEWHLRLGPLTHYAESRRRFRAVARHCRACAEEINNDSFDVFLANSCGDLVVSPIGRYVKTPKVLYLPEPRRWLYEAAPDAAPSVQRKNPIMAACSTLLRQAHRDEELESVRAYDLILTNSLYSREALLRAYGLESSVCYLGVDADLFKTADVALGNYVVGLGEVDDRKGVDRAIRAVATIAEQDRPDLIWIGNRTTTEYQERIEALAQSLGVRFVPKLMLDDTELVRLLAGAAAMIYTSRLEPFGLAPLEASACGTPVVAIAEGGVRETVTNEVNGLTVRGDDPVALGQAVLRLLKDQRLRDELGRNGRDLVSERWTWRTAVDSLEAYLESVPAKAAKR